MAAVAAPYGFRPIGLTGGQAYAGAIRQIKVTNSYGTSIFFGDPVKLVAAGTIEKDAGTDALTPIGIFMGCEYTDPTLNYKLQAQMWTASTSATDIMAYVCDDPDAEFQIQADDSVEQTDLGANFGIVQTAGSTTIGTSKVALDATSSAATNTLPLRLVGFVNGPDAAIADAKTDCIVRWNVGHAYRNTTGI